MKQEVPDRSRVPLLLIPRSNPSQWCTRQVWFVGLHGAASWPAFTVNPHMRLTACPSTSPGITHQGEGRLQKSVPFSTNRCGLLLLERSPCGLLFGFDTVNNDAYSPEAWTVLHTGPLHGRKRSPRTKQSIAVDSAGSWEHKLWMKLPDFTGVCVIFHISIPADLFRLWGRKRPPADLQFAKPSLEEGGFVRGGEHKTHSSTAP